MLLFVAVALPRPAILQVETPEYYVNSSGPRSIAMTPAQVVLMTVELRSRSDVRVPRSNSAPHSGSNNCQEFTGF